MSVIGSNILAGASGQGGYFLTNSLRFRSSASAYLNRTPASATNQKTWTWSGWVKRGTLGTYNFGLIFCDTGSNANKNEFGFFNTDSLFFEYTNGGITQADLKTTQVFRDPSAWYHIVLAVDTTQATASNRIKMYVNGSQITSFSASTYPSQNTDMYINSTNVHDIGRGNRNSGAIYLDAYLTELNFIDGQQLTPSSFGETSATTGVWIPKKFSGTYGTNGFYLPFTNTTSTSTLGNDFSGNSNTWTVNNISLTAGSTYDSMTDVPTLTSATTANYCVANPLEKGSAFTVSNGNLTIDINASKPVFASVKGTFGITSGKWYWECVKTSSGSGLSQSGVWASDNLSLNINSDLNGNLASLNNIGMFGSTAAGDLIKTGLNSQDYATLGSYTNGDVIGIAFDADSGKLYAYKNGTEFTGQAIGSGTSILPTMATGKTYQPFVYSGNGGSGTENATTNINFGQRPFTYTPPSGFVALNTFNLPTPTIGATAAELANEYFDATTYTGTGSSQLISNSGLFQPNFVWIKQRSAAGQHNLMDVLRAGFRLRTDDTAADSSSSTLFSFASTGFNVLTSNASYNASAGTYVAWQWKASDSGVTNTAGSITSTVSASTTAGFSIVTYTGNGTGSATVGHGLGATPSMVIVKRRSAASDWPVSSRSISAGQILVLNSTNAVSTDNGPFASTYPSSTVITLGTSTDTNANTATYVAYCFAQIAGYSAFGSYTGNGSTDGPFIFTGFRPRFVMIKSTVEISNWFVWDTSRSTYNAEILILMPSVSDAEFSDATYAIDALSNGFKIRGLGQYAGYNNSGNAYIYMAFAENPFKYANAR